VPQAQSSDTTGWFARDATNFAKVASVMLDALIPSALPSRLLIAGQSTLRKQRRAQHFYGIANSRNRVSMGTAGAAGGAWRN
jgi:hypothetical protein